MLAFLRDDDRPRYRRNVQALLAGDKIRPHLKLLVIEMLAALSDPGEDEWDILLPWIESEHECLRLGKPNEDKIATRVFEAFRSSRSLFPVADRLGYFERWLGSSESWLEEIMLTYLRWQSCEHGDRVAEFLETYVGRGGEWDARLSDFMDGRHLEKSRRFFDLFLRLLRDGTLDHARDRFFSGESFWSMLYGLTKERPRWCAEVAACWLDRRVVRALEAREVGLPVSVPMHDHAGVDNLIKSARRAPKVFLACVIPAVIRAAEATLFPNEGDFPRDSIWPLRVTGDHPSLNCAYLNACEVAFDGVAENNPKGLISTIRILRESRTYVANSLLLNAYSAAGKTFSEEAISLLVSEPTRLLAGFSDSSYWISRCVIEKLSPHCAEELFRDLEETLIAYRSDYERERDDDGIAGLASYTLLSALPLRRCSTKVLDRLAELNQKFGKPDAAPRGIRCYTIVSPVSEDTATGFDDTEWLATMEKYRGVSRSGGWENPELGGEESFAGMLRKFVEQEPERFARLALQFPADVANCYWMNVLNGLAGAEISASLQMDVARRTFGRTDDSCVMAAVDLLGKITDEMLPVDAIEFLVRSATEHPDPDRELWRAEKEGEVGCFGGDILNCGINTVRGRAAEAIRDLLYRDRRYLDAFLPTIERLILDPSVSVRSCVASTLLAVAVHDEELSLALLERLLADAEDALLETHYVEDFIRRALSRHLLDMRGYIHRMLGSERPQVRKAGGRLATLACLTDLEAEDLAAKALAGDSSSRLGVAEVTNYNFLLPNCREWCERTLIGLFDDADVEVRKQTANCFWHLRQNPEIPLTDYKVLISRFLTSPAFAEDPSFLIYAIEESRRKLPEVVLEVCEHFVERCADLARDIRTSFAADDHSVGPLVFRAYQQLANDPGQLRALRLIDRMCEEGMNSAATNLRDFER